MSTSHIKINCHLLLAYNGHTKQLAPSWPDSSTGGALHRHCRDQGSNPTHDQAGIKLSSSIHEKTVRITHLKVQFNPQFKYMTFMYQHRITYIYLNIPVTETNNLINNAYLQRIFVTDWTNLI